MTINNKCLLQYFLIYLCFLNTSSKAATMFGDAFIVVTLIICFTCFLLNRFKIKKRYFKTLLLIFSFITVQHVIIQGNISFTSIVNLLSKFAIAYCAVSINYSRFIERFVRVTLFLATCSLICYAISFTSGEVLLTKFFITNYAPCWTGNVSYGRFIYHYMPGYIRNVGIFNEPGVFQIYLNLALFCALFWPERCNFRTQKVKLIATVLLTITIATSASTAGYITTIIVFGGYVFSIRKQMNIKSFFVLMIAIFALSIFTQTEFFNMFFLRKMELSGQGTFAGSTGNARLASILIDIQYIKQNIWGYGFSGTWINTSTIAKDEIGSSVGLSAVFYTYGVPIAVLIYYYFLKSFYNVSKKPIDFIVLLGTFISSFLSQPWVLTPVYLMIFSYGFFHVNKSESNDCM